MAVLKKTGLVRYMSQVSILRSNKTVSTLLVVTMLLCLTACGKPMLVQSDRLPDKQQALRSGAQLFQATLKAHGAEAFSSVTDVNLRLEGQWSYWAPKIQPLVADRTFRVASEERYIPNKGIYTAYYTGPAGNKKVVRTPKSIEIYYNGAKSTDAKRMQTSAMTADAFLLFSLGPLYLSTLETNFEQITDIEHQGQRYLRLYSQIKPGLGYAESDDVVLWIHPETKLTFRVDTTLRGYPPTAGAHVDVFYLDYQNIDDLILPVHVIENIVAPVNIKAHEWRVTGADTNRGYDFADIDDAGWTGAAVKPAREVK